MAHERGQHVAAERATGDLGQLCLWVDSHLELLLHAGPAHDPAGHRRWRHGVIEPPGTLTSLSSEPKALRLKEGCHLCWSGNHSVATLNSITGTAC